jgi:cytochrome c
MKRFAVFLGLLLAPALVVYGSVSGSDGEAMMKKSDCFSCHSVRQKLVGPAYIDVAKKYRGKKGALVLLVKKVKEGGSGNWGSAAMVAHPGLPDSDIKVMLQWVLKQK